MFFCFARVCADCSAWWNTTGAIPFFPRRSAQVFLLVFATALGQPDAFLCAVELLTRIPIDYA